MKKSTALASVSVAALLTAVGVSGARADNALYNLNILPPTLTLTGSSSIFIANQQNNLLTSVNASNAGNSIVVPVFPNPQDVEGGVISSLSQFNTIFALAIGNAAISPVYSVTPEIDLASSKAGNDIDLFTADGAGTKGAATAASLQSNFNVGITASTSNANISATYEDLGTGSSDVLDSDSILADVVGNIASTVVSGNLNSGLVSTEIGQSHLQNPGAPTYELQAGATVLVSNAQLNGGLTSASSSVTGSRIGSQATVDGTPADLNGVNFDVTNNLIRAGFTGNDSANQVTVKNAKDMTLDGSAGIANVQGSSGQVAYSASVTTSQIEAGVSSTSKGVADLNGGSLDFKGNDILAASTANSADNLIDLTMGISLIGANQATQQNQLFAGSPDTADVIADLFIQTVQYSQVDATANNQGDMFVLVEDLNGAAVNADANTIGSEATGDDVTNTLKVEGATTFDATVAVQSAQYAENNQTATTGAAGNGANLLVSVATLGTSAGAIAGSDVSTEDNRLYSEAVGNSQDGTLDLNGQSLTVGIVPDASAFIKSDRPATKVSAPADVTFVSAQVLDGGAADAVTISNIRVNAALNGGTGITGSDIVTSGNEIPPCRRATSPPPM